MLGAISSGPSRIFFADGCISSASYELSGRVLIDVDSERLGVLSVTDATGDERDDVDAEMSGGVVPPVPLPLLFERLVGSLT